METSILSEGRPASEGRLKAELWRSQSRLQAVLEDEARRLQSLTLEALTAKALP